MLKGPIIAYLVIRDNEHELFAKKVMAALKNGYQCRGKMQTQRTSSYGFDYLQNMVKRGEKPAQQ